MRNTADEEGILQCNLSQMSHLSPVALRTSWHSVLSGTICNPVPSATLVFHISCLRTMLYFDHCICKVCQDALHIVDIANHFTSSQASKKSFCNAQFTHRGLSSWTYKFPRQSTEGNTQY